MLFKGVATICPAPITPSFLTSAAAMAELELKHLACRLHCSSWRLIIVVSMANIAESMIVRQRKGEKALNLQVDSAEHKAYAVATPSLFDCPSASRRTGLSLAGVFFRSRGLRRVSRVFRQSRV